MKYAVVTQYTTSDVAYLHPQRFSTKEEAMGWAASRSKAGTYYVVRVDGSITVTHY
jgi:hypothetical protein